MGGREGLEMFCSSLFYQEGLCSVGEKCLGNLRYYPLSIVLPQIEYKGKILCLKQHIVLKGSQKYKKCRFYCILFFRDIQDNINIRTIERNSFMGLSSESVIL